jgi:hypothetical protein
MIPTKHQLLGTQERILLEVVDRATKNNTACLAEQADYQLFDKC